MSPRNGRTENGPAVYCWAAVVRTNQSVKRTAEEMDNFNRRLRGLKPGSLLLTSDESLGYFHIVHFADD